MAKGGARHTAKPQVDEGLLFKAMSNHSGLLKNLGSYEHISTSQGCDPKGLVKILPLVQALVDLEGTCEIHPSCLRKGIFSVLMQEPRLNDTKYSGNVWTNLKIERITVILSHVRRLAGPSGLKQCAARLSGAEYLQLQEVVEKVSKKAAAVSEAGVLPVEESPLTKRRLKKEISDVSLNSRGMPNRFGTPESENEKSPLTERVGNGSLTKGASSSRPKAMAKPSFIRRRPGQTMFAARPEEKKEMFKGELALTKEKGKKKVLTKKPASLTKGGGSKGKAISLTKGGGSKGKAISLSKGGGSKAGSDAKPAERKKWQKLMVTSTKKPPFRTYICGTTEHKGKLSLIVETTERRHPMYQEILAEIKRRLEKDHLTKAEAIDLRQALYNSW